MKLSKIGVTDMQVKAILGTGERDLGTLCTYPYINIYSRSRPGYWRIDDDQNIIYQKPRGRLFTDGRGVDVEYNSNKELFKVTDFFGYDDGKDAPTFAYKPRWASTHETVKFSEAGETKMINNIFLFGDVDWFGYSTIYREKNAVGMAMTHLHIVEGDTIIKSYLLDNIKTEIESYHTLSVDFEVQEFSSGSRFFQIAFGQENNILAKFPSSLVPTFEVESLGVTQNYSIAIFDVTQAAIDEWNSFHTPDVGAIYINSVGLDSQKVYPSNNFYSVNSLSFIFGLQVGDQPANVTISGYVEKNGVKVNIPDFTGHFTYFSELGYYQGGLYCNLTENPADTAGKGNTYILRITSIV